MAKQKYERFHMFTACERCGADRHQPGSRRVHFNLHNPHLRKWIRPSRGIFRPCEPLFWTSECELLKDRFRVEKFCLPLTLMNMLCYTAKSPIFQPSYLSFLLKNFTINL